MYVYLLFIGSKLFASAQFTFGENKFIVFIDLFHANFEQQLQWFGATQTRNRNTMVWYIPNQVGQTTLTRWHILHDLKKKPN